MASQEVLVLILCLEEVLLLGQWLGYRRLPGTVWLSFLRLAMCCPRLPFHISGDLAEKQVCEPNMDQTRMALPSAILDHLPTRVGCAFSLPSWIIFQVGIQNGWAMVDHRGVSTLTSKQWLCPLSTLKVLRDHTVGNIGNHHDSNCQTSPVIQKNYLAPRSSPNAGPANAVMECFLSQEPKPGMAG